MAVQWGAWKYASGNGMRVGVDVSAPSSVSNGTGSFTVSYSIYTQNQYTFSDDQTLSFSGANDGSGSVGFRNSSGSGSVKRATRSYKYTYGANSYGSSPGNKSFTAKVSGVFSGITPSVTVSWKIPARPYAKPAAPTNVTLTRVSDSAMKVTWTNRPTAAKPYGYVTVGRLQNGSSWINIANPGGTTTSFTNSGNFANRRWLYRVEAKNSAGGSGNTQASRSAWGTPATVTSLSRTAQSNGQMIRWSVSSIGYPEYNTLIYRAQNGVWGTNPVARVAGGYTSWLDTTNLSKQSVWHYRARVQCTGAGHTGLYSGYSNNSTGTAVSFEQPSPPSSFSAARNSDSQIKLAWANNVSAARPYSNLIIQWQQSLETATWSSNITLGVTTSYTHSGLTGNLRYRYQIRSSNAAGLSGWIQSGWVYTTPAAPTGATVTESGSNLVVTWKNNVSYTQYQTQVWRAVNGVWGTSPRATLNPGVATWTDTGVGGSGDSYAYRIRAVTTQGEQLFSGYSTTLPTVPMDLPPEKPINLEPNDQTNREVFGDPSVAIRLSWTYVANDLDDSDQTKYFIRYHSIGEEEWHEETVQSSSKFHLIPADTYSVGDQIEWQVQTWGNSFNESPMSAMATFPCKLPPPPKEPNRYPLVLDLDTGKESVIADRLSSIVTGVGIVKAVAISAISAAGEQIVDGVPLSAGDRVLLAAQANGAENGIYLVTTGAWIRAIDANTSERLALKTVVVAEGSANQGQMWHTTFRPSMILGVDRVTWLRHTTTTSRDLDSVVTNIQNKFKFRVAGGNHSGTTDANGNITVTHGQGATPVFAKGTYRTSVTYDCFEYTWTATTISFVLVNATSGARLANTAVTTLAWMAVFPY